jgi:hypothetical protein
MRLSSISFFANPAASEYRFRNNLVPIAPWEIKALQRNTAAFFRFDNGNSFPLAYERPTGPFGALIHVPRATTMFRLNHKITSDKK